MSAVPKGRLISRDAVSALSIAGGGTVVAHYDSGSSPVFSGALLDRTGTTPENQITFAGFSHHSTAWINQSTYGNFNQNEIRPVPEPATYGALFISGGFGLSAFRHYRRHRLAGRAA